MSEPPTTRLCANCGASVEARHCGVCGQEADDYHRPIWNLFSDALEDLFELDGRFLNTVPPLIFRPGAVTAAYLRGARRRFVQPFRLFLFTSIVFLAAASMATGGWGGGARGGVAWEMTAEELDRYEREVEAVAARMEAAGQPLPASIGTARQRIALRRAALSAVDPTLAAQLHEMAATADRRSLICRIRRAILPEEPLEMCESDMPREIDVAGGPATEFFAQFSDAPLQLRRMIATHVAAVINQPERFVDQLNVWTSRILIALFPAYALLLAAVHAWRPFYLYDHLVTSLHAHAFAFIVLTALIAASAVLPAWLIVAIFVCWSVFYVYRVERLVYASGPIAAGVRAGVLLALYALLLLAALFALLLAGLLSV